MQAVQRQGLDQTAFVDRLAWVAVLVDQAICGPGEVVIQGVRGELRQGAHPHVNGVQSLEPFRKVVGEHGDEAGRQAALRHKDLPGTCPRSRFADGICGSDVFGQIEVTCAGPQRRPSHARIIVEAQGRDHALAALHGGCQGFRLVHVEHDRFHVGHLP